MLYMYKVPEEFNQWDWTDRMVFIWERIHKMGKMANQVVRYKYHQKEESLSVEYI